MLRTCVRSSRLSLYARTQRLTENAPYKGLWLVVKTTTNQPHSVKCRKAALASIHPNLQNGNQGGMAVIRPSICLLPFWEQAKSVGQFGQLKKPDELFFWTACPEQECRGAGRQWQPQKAASILKHRPSRQARPQPFEGSQGGTPCPSDMMLCVISYWVLSGAKRRQIQQLRCCVLSRKDVETEIRKIIYGQIIYI